MKFLVHINEKREEKRFIATKPASVVSNSLETGRHPHSGISFHLLRSLHPNDEDKEGGTSPPKPLQFSV
jgi:hypothetical protein